MPALASSKEHAAVKHKRFKANPNPRTLNAISPELEQLLAYFTKVTKDAVLHQSHGVSGNSSLQAGNSSAPGFKRNG